MYAVNLQDIERAKQETYWMSLQLEESKRKASKKADHPKKESDVGAKITPTKMPTSDTVKVKAKGGEITKYMTQGKQK